MELKYKEYGFDEANDCKKRIPIVTEKEINLFIKHRYNNQKDIRNRAKTSIRKIKQQFKIEYWDYIKLTQECAICGFSELINLHHIIPKSKDGTDTIDNYIGLCPNCHNLHHLKRWSLDEIRNWYMKQM